MQSSILNWRGFTKKTGISHLGVTDFSQAHKDLDD